MKITQFEQSGMVIESDSGYRLAIDIGKYTPLERLAEVSVDAVVVSHLHGDHLSLEHIRALAPQQVFLSQECIDELGDGLDGMEVVLIAVGNEFLAGDIAVAPFIVDHGPNASVQPKENFGFLFHVDGQHIYFAGDMYYPSGIAVNDLEVDVAVVPVGGFYTFGPEEAVDFVKTFKKVERVLPMHYHKTPETKEQFETLATAAGVVVYGMV